MTWTELLGPWREQVLARIADPEARRALLRRIAGPEMEACLRAGAGGGAASVHAQALVQTWLDEAAPRGKDVHAS